ncbi:MAG: hypothetical protein H7068_13470 [Pedobacter sp.]|nr:hypothetical protein [Chitinophagaceae bacterium]
MSFLPIIVIVTATIGIFISSFIIGSAAGEKNKIDKLKNHEDISVNIQSSQQLNNKRWLFIGTVVLLICHMLVIFILTNLQHYKRYQLREYFLYASFIAPLSIFAPIYYLVGKEIIYRYSYLITVFLILYMAQQIGHFRKSEAEAIKNEPCKCHLSFVYKSNKTVSTSDTIVFVGQTQSSIFLYKKSDSSTLVFNRSNIDSLVMK